VAATIRSGLVPGSTPAGGAGGGGAEVELTDGWYSVTGRLDPALSELLRRGRLFVGQKLLVQGCELGGGQEPAPPLSDAADSMWLSLHSNGRVGTFHHVILQSKHLSITGGGRIYIETAHPPVGAVYVHSDDSRCSPCNQSDIRE
jgi:hypothetical protein